MLITTITEIEKKKINKSRKFKSNRKIYNPFGQGTLKKCSRTQNNFNIL